ncbi:MAG: ABC transporter ATP-binding protein [Ruminococcus sp.]|jgi:oligopeptide transport system ATP-binding protein
MEPLLEVKNLTKIFRDRGQAELTAVKDVSFCLYPRETLAIVGESGSGKSTVAKLIARLLEADSGEILLEGRDITRAKGKELKKIYRKFQMVFQSPAGSFDPRRRLGDGIGESLRNTGMAKEKVKERVKDLLRQCGLSEEYARRYPHEVSGGECQRAAIARGLAIQPLILICDEATSALDVTVQRQIVELLAGLQKENGMSCLFICHDLALVQQFCDRVLVMQGGSIVEEGTPDEVIMNPRHNYTKSLVDAVI